MSTTVALETLGCRLNQAESEDLARRFRAQGYRVVEPDASADIYVLNTCTVTHVADQKARHLISATRRRNPDALLVVTGCFAERVAPHLEGSSLVVGNADKERIVPLVMERWPVVPNGNGNVEDGPHRTRGAIKIQEGCDDVCSYCVVPRTRGRERSVPADEVVAQVRRCAAEGYREVVLTGTQPGYYGRDREGHADADLSSLVRRILDETGIWRLRLSSLQPQNVTPELLALFADRRLCRHLHMPLQSGSDAVLQHMRRRYTVADYRRAVETARAAIPDLSITTDVIVGFPGETDAEFEESIGFCEALSFAAMHVFPCSRRPGTAAARLAEQVPRQVKKERSERMIEAAREMACRFRQGFLGRTLEVLWEAREPAGAWSGLTDNYIRVFAATERLLANRLLPAHMVAAGERGLWCEPELTGTECWLAPG
ncbi:MAG: tRNA (N(6)-L-threonylcarbamoyladenosine(37)-C(2))-methylthiotransferase MtaB [Chloroflexi bacterium]|nr:tRNA (N(6)-L-threonylcarbamoyladenosine(37)-C(2))-methylthiotransferase MtaB [Chloroflexota bacterium]